MVRLSSIQEIIKFDNNIEMETMKEFEFFVYVPIWSSGLSSHTAISYGDGGRNGQEQAHKHAHDISHDQHASVYDVLVADTLEFAIDCHLGESH